MSKKYIYIYFTIQVLWCSRIIQVKIEGHIYKRNAVVLYKIEEDVMEVLVLSSIYIINSIF